MASNWPHTPDPGLSGAVECAIEVLAPQQGLSAPASAPTPTNDEWGRFFTAAGPVRNGLARDIEREQADQTKAPERELRRDLDKDHSL